jgi:hypothetical protein
MFDALWTQPALDAEQLHAMVVFGRRIDEPAETLRWAGRLAEEHPEDPRALNDLVDALHEVELRSPPALGDTIRRWLPALDRAYRRAPVPNMGYEDARRLAACYGDSSAGALWLARGVENGAVGNIWLLTQRASRSPADSAAAEIRRRATQACVLPSGRLPFISSVAEWRARCELFRGMAYAYLSSATLEAGRARLALDEADSAIAGMRRGGLCASPRGYRVHALAALALRDTATAESDFIVGAAGASNGFMPLMDTAQARLGVRFDRAAATVRLDSARQVVRACESAARSRRKARERDRAG